MPHKLKVLVAPVEGLGIVPSTYMMAHSWLLLSSADTQYYAIHIHTHRPNIHNTIKSSNFFRFMQFYMYECFVQLYVLSITFVPGARGGKTRVWDSLKLKLQIFTCCYVGAWTLTWLFSVLNW